LNTESQTRIREFMLANLQIKRNNSVRMDMDKEIRPQSRGGSSCGNRSLNSTMNLNATSGSNFNNPGTPHEVNIMRFDDDDNNNNNDDYNDNGGSDKPSDFSLQPISRKLSISELRKMNSEKEERGEEYGLSDNIMRENNDFNVNNNKSISMQRRSISESRNQENKENDIPRRKLPPTLPSKKRNTLEPLRTQSEKINLENDVFKEENGFDLSFSETIKNRNRNENKQD